MATITRTMGGEVFEKKSCFGKKTEAKAAAEKLRAGGKKARVVKDGKANCVFVGTGKAAVKTRKTAKRK